jgi:hypothetical protein
LRVEEILNKIEKKFGVEYGINAGVFKDGQTKIVSRGKAILARPDEWQKFRERMLKIARKAT